MWSCCWKPAEWRKNVQKTKNSAAKDFSTMAKKCSSSVICVIHFTVRRRTLVSTDAVLQSLLKVKAVQCWLESTEWTELEAFVQDSLLLEATKLSNLCSKDIQNIPFIKRHVCICEKKMIYSFNIFWTQRSETREGCCASYWAGHLLNEFNASPLELITRPWLFAHVAPEQKGQWKLPAAQIYSRLSLFLPSKHFVHTELVCISWKLLPAWYFLYVSRLHWQLITAAFWNLPLGTNLIP